MTGVRWLSCGHFKCLFVLIRFITNGFASSFIAYYESHTETNDKINYLNYNIRFIIIFNTRSKSKSFLENLLSYFI